VDRFEVGSRIDAGGKLNQGDSHGGHPPVRPDWYRCRAGSP
jgi:hypothetical protein